MILDLSKLQAENEQAKTQLQATLEKMRQDTERYERESRANIAKIQAETAKLQKETKFYPWLAIAGAILASSVLSGAIGAIVASLLK